MRIHSLCKRWFIVRYASGGRVVVTGFKQRVVHGQGEEWTGL
jgi:hypothetical protein